MSAGPRSPRTRVVLIDHRDSFVFLLADQLARCGAATRVYRCDLPLAVLQDRLAADRPHLVVLSPGPGRPQDTGVTLPWLASRPAVPVLGVCLGHQALAVAHGGRVARAAAPVHGVASLVECVADPRLAGLPASLTVARYHSLVVTDVPAACEVVARTVDGEVMAMRHRTLPQLGLQFHPESVLTPHGAALLDGVLNHARGVVRATA